MLVLQEALWFYKKDGGMRTKKIQGPIIEFDSDAGPLRDVYEVPIPDNGETARDALAEVERIARSEE